MTADLARLLQGTLLTRDFLIEGIKGAPEYAAVPDEVLTELRKNLSARFLSFPVAKSPGESQTEDDLIWPVLKTLGWTSALRQQNLSVKGRDDVPDGLLFADEAEKAKANAHSEEWKRYAYGLAVVESKRWQRPLDRRSNRKGEETAPSTQMLRYLRRVDVVTEGSLRWGILTNGAKWRLYFQGAKSVSEEFCEIDLQVALGIASDSGGLFDPTDAELDHWLKVFLLIFSRRRSSPALRTRLHSFSALWMKGAITKSGSPRIWPISFSIRRFRRWRAESLNLRRLLTCTQFAALRWCCSTGCFFCSTQRTAICCPFATNGSMITLSASVCGRMLGVEKRPTTHSQVRQRNTGERSTTSPVPSTRVTARSACRPTTAACLMRRARPFWAKCACRTRFSPTSSTYCRLITLVRRAATSTIAI